jgi:hypothetical protein
MLDPAATHRADLTCATPAHESAEIGAPAGSGRAAHRLL